MKIQIIIGSTRKGRKSERVAKWVHKASQSWSEVEFELVDLRDYPLPFYEEEGSPQMLEDDIPTAKKWRDKISEADGYIIVSPEYNHGYTAVLKNAMDYLYKPWNKKPVAFVSYGSIGGARAIEQLRLVAIQLQMAPIEHSITIMGVGKLIDENGTISDDSYNERADRLFKDLIWWTQALKKARLNPNASV